MITSISKQIATHIHENDTQTNQSIEVYQYGVDIILRSVVKLGIILVVGAFLNVFLLTLTAMMTFVCMRRVAGGVHSNSFVNCSIIGGISFILMARISKVLPFGNYILFTLVSTSCIFALIVIFKYVPGYSHKKSSNKIADIKKQKKESFVLLFVYIVFICFFSYLGYLEYVSVVAMSLSFEMFTITPYGYKGVQYLDNLTMKEVKS